MVLEWEEKTGRHYNEARRIRSEALSIKQSIANNNGNIAKLETTLIALAHLVAELATELDDSAD